MAWEAPCSLLGQEKLWWKCPVTMNPVVFTQNACMLPFLQYVRVSSDTPPRVIYHLMTQHWGLDAPNLLISVTGGAKNFIMKPRLKNIFRQGLVKVAQTTGKRCRGSPCDCSGRGACHLAVPGSVSWAAVEVPSWPRRPVGPCLDYCHQGWTVLAQSLQTGS